MWFTANVPSSVPTVAQNATNEQIILITYHTVRYTSYYSIQIAEGLVRSTIYAHIQITNT